eukprot:761689-Amphidinium_carterae.1
MRVSQRLRNVPGEYGQRATLLCSTLKNVFMNVTQKDGSLCQGFWCGSVVARRWSFQAHYSMIAFTTCQFGDELYCRDNVVCYVDERHWLMC